MVVFQCNKVFLHSFICGASNSEQLLNTELRQDKINQVLTKTSPKSRNIGRSKVMVVFQATKCFRVPLYKCGASNSEQLIYKHRIASRQGKSN